MRRRTFLAAIGAAACAVPAAAEGQRKAMIGLLSSGGRIQGFAQGLSEEGYDEGRNLAIDYRLALGHHDQLAKMTAGLVSRNVDLIAAFGSSATRAAKDATSTIPIVFISGDPVAEGLVASLAHPGANLTGMSIISVELLPKRLELLSGLVPQAKKFALLVDPADVTTEGMIRQAQKTARSKRLELLVLRVSETDMDAIDAAFNKLRQFGTGGLIVGTDALNVVRLPYLVQMASQHAIPTIYFSSEFVWGGGLISYGPSLNAVARQMGVYAGKILRGAKPADLPVVEPVKFELVINLKTAKALGLTVPPSLVARADEVIE